MKKFNDGDICVKKDSQIKIANNKKSTAQSPKEELYESAKLLVESYDKDDAYFAFYAGQLYASISKYKGSIMP